MSTLLALAKIKHNHLGTLFYYLINVSHITKYKLLLCIGINWNIYKIKRNKHKLHTSIHSKIRVIQDFFLTIYLLKPN